MKAKIGPKNYYGRDQMIGDKIGRVVRKPLRYREDTWRRCEIFSILVLGSRDLVLGSRDLVLGSCDLVLGSHDLVLGSCDLVLGSCDLTIYQVRYKLHSMHNHHAKSNYVACLSFEPIC